MLIQLDPRSNTPIWEQIVSGMKELVLRNMLSPGDKLPSVRELASLLVVNPNTVSKAYQELERQGIIETLRGRGTFVAALITPKHDEQKVISLKQQLKQILLDASYLGISPETICEWVQEESKALGGMIRAEGKPSNEND